MFPSEAVKMFLLLYFLSSVSLPRDPPLLICKSKAAAAAAIAATTTTTGGWEGEGGRRAETAAVGRGSTSARAQTDVTSSHRVTP